MWVRMLDTRRGSPDGFKVERYFKDGIYELPHSLALSFIFNGYAEKTTEPRVPSNPQTYLDKGEAL